MKKYEIKVTYTMYVEEKEANLIDWEDCICDLNTVDEVFVVDRDQGAPIILDVERGYDLSVFELVPERSSLELKWEN